MVRKLHSTGVRDRSAKVIWPSAGLTLRVVEICGFIFLFANGAVRNLIANSLLRVHRYILNGKHLSSSYFFCVSHITGPVPNSTAMKATSEAQIGSEFSFLLFVRSRMPFLAQPMAHVDRSEMPRRVSILWCKPQHRICRDHDVVLNTKSDGP